MKYFSFFLLTLAFLIYGCAPKVVPLTHSTPDSRQQTATGKDGLTQGDQKAREGGVTEEDLQKSTKAGDRWLRDGSAASSLKDVFFDFDSYVLRKEDSTVLAGIAEWMRQNKEIKIKIEGHCDERGTAAYNLALGQKRAEAVREYLVSAGVDAKRIATISYGKELPATTGQGEDAWAKNRRAHVTIDEKR